MSKLKNIDEAWLNLDDLDDSNLINPFSMVKFNEEDYHYKLIWLMTRPEYFSFLCKHVFNITILPSQALFLCEMWNRKFPMLIASRGFGKSFILSLYSMIRALLLPERKVVVVGAAFRQSKVLFEYMETIWNNAPILRSMCDTSSGPRRDVDRCVMRINKSRITCLPLGDGQKIRGQRANDIISEEFASITENKSNQIILSGTAYYDFNHFAEYWKKWKLIIKSQGKPNRLREIFGEDAPKDFNWKDYSIIRVPYELLPEGFMDASQVARSKATVHAGIYQMEFGACFTRDSQGFFKRTLMESCVSNEGVDNKTPILDQNEKPIIFEAKLIGSKDKKYIYGIDPASEVDNFSIVVIELSENHRKIVHCWTTNRSEHKDKVKKGFSRERDFYAYCVRKIRDLMKLFPCVHIALDAQGGGIAVMEGFHDNDKIQSGEMAIWPTIDEDKEKDTDGEQGLHILEMCQFAKHEWLSEANHGMRKDFEDKVLLFPRFDSVSLDISSTEDTMKGRSFDTLEQCVMEIEELKDELAMIQITQTASGRDKWDTPETIVGTGKKGKQRKDRYSALLMANMAARIISRTPTSQEYNFYGGFATTSKSEKKQKDLYIGPNWFTNSMKDIY